MDHRSADELNLATDDVRQAPRDAGEVRLLVARPGDGERVLLDAASLNSQVGLVGDGWSQRPDRRSDDGRPDPAKQLTLMGWRAVTALADDDADRALAGDQIYVDLNLSTATLPPGSRVTIGRQRGGTAIVEISAAPHRGCAKFAARFGRDALRWVNSDDGVALNLRGVNATVVEDGDIRVGDVVELVRRSS